MNADQMKIEARNASHIINRLRKATSDGQLDLMGSIPGGLEAAAACGEELTEAYNMLQQAEMALVAAKGKIDKLANA
jgi:hypothetical protein